MPIAYRGIEPSIKMSQRIYNDLRKYSVSSASNILAVFLKIDKDLSTYRVKEIYVPEQSCNTEHCVITEHELRKLGTEYMGLCRMGHGTKLEPTKNDYELFDKSFSGVDNYVTMNFISAGNMSADIIDGDIEFQDVRIFVNLNVSKEETKEIRELLDSRVKVWSYKDSYTPTERGTYVQAELLVDNIPWRDIV